MIRRRVKMKVKVRAYWGAGVVPVRYTGQQSGAVKSSCIGKEKERSKESIHALGWRRKGFLIKGQKRSGDLLRRIY